jgi:phosphoesterase RecJ-like protein
MQNTKGEQFKELLSSPKNIVITTHFKPDADALGSSLALAIYLKIKGHRVQVISPSDYPKFLNWLPGQEEVISLSEDTTLQITSLIENADLIFCLDFSALSRINDLCEMVRASAAEKVMIDHHLNPEQFANYHYWNCNAAATAELIYDFIIMLGDQHLINIDMAECIYAGIMTDTGSFRFPCTSKKVHHIIAELIEIGADNSKVHRLIYDNNSENRLRFIGYALSTKMEVLTEFNAVFFAISAAELEQFDSQTGDTEGLVNYGLSIDGITMAAAIIEREDAIKISFRSVGDFAVNEFAALHFEGGGHKNASGGKSSLSLAETVEKFKKLLHLYKEQLTQN